MGKTLGYGEITVANMTEPFTVMLTNEAQQFATDSNRKVTSAQSYYTDIIVIRGSQERTDYTIGNITSGSGITVSKSSKRVTFSVSAGTTISADAGVIEIPITLDGQTVKKQFSWSCGKQGPQGAKGNPGTSITITSKSVTYQASSSGTTAPTGTWSTSVPTVNHGQYLWTKTTVQYSDGNKTEAYSVSYKGTNGTNGTSVTVSKTEVTYQVSTSGTTAPTGTWSTTMPTCDQGLYLWTKTYVKYSDGKDTTSYSVSYKGVDGEKFSWNMINNGKGNEKRGFFKNFSSVNATEEYGEITLTSKHNYIGIDLPGFVLSPRQYEVGKKVTWSYDIMYTKWDFPTGSNRQEYWMGQRYTNAASGETATGQWVGVTSHNLPVVGQNGCELNKWFHVEVTKTIPTPSSSNVGYQGCINFYNSTDISATVTFRMKNVKLEYGDTATPWSPSQSDLEGRGVSETVQYYLATSQASGVTSSTSGWSTDITTQKLTADKKYLWNCYQTKYSDGTSEPISTPKVIGVYGDKGVDGQDGQDGAGFHWNLLSGTKDFDKTKMSIAGATSFDPQKYLGLTVIKAVSPTSGYIDPVAWNNVITPTPNTQYTISFYAKASVATRIASFFYPNCTIKNVSNYHTTTAPDGCAVTKLSTEWNRYSVTWTTSSSVSGVKNIIPVRLEHNNTTDGATVYFCGVKIEQSDKPSPWCTTYEETLAKNLSITPSSQYFKSTDGGKTFAPNTITIKPTIQGEISFGKWQYSIDGGVSFADVVSGQKGLTINNNVLSVSKDSSLYSDAVTMVTFRAVANDNSFYDTCSIAKIYDVSDIQIGGRNLARKGCIALWDTSTTLNDDTFSEDGSATFSRKSAAVNAGVIIDRYVNYEQGQQYVISFKMKVTSGTVNNFYVYNQIGHSDNSVYVDGVKSGVLHSDIVFPTDGSYHQVDIYFTAASINSTEASDIAVTHHLILQPIKATAATYTVQLLNFKIEKGNYPTDWTPAPEDVQTAILSTKSEISSVSSQVDQNTKSIKDRVEKTTYQNDLKLVKGDISKANEGLNKWRYEIYPKSLFTTKTEDQSKSTLDVFARNKNITPSQSVLINDIDLSIAWNYAENYIGYAVTFVKFSVAKSVAITFAHDGGAHIYLNGKLIGGSDAYNNTGESLTLGFVKGWNCIEVVVNEGASTEGFKLGTTISAISECQLMNCYYGTPVARQSHITNQLVQNTTDIDGVSGSVQKVMSTVGDSGNIDEFVNNYSTWKKKVNGIETRVGETYTTKDEFNGLEIGGRNLLLGTKDFSNGIQSYGNGNFELTSYNSFTVLKAKLNGENYYDPFLQSIEYEPNTKYTLSFYAKADSSCHIYSYFYNIGDDGKYFDGATQTTLTTSWKRYSITWTTGNITRTANVLPMRIQGSSWANIWCYMYGLKLEKGSKSSDWTPAPEDNEINGQNLVSNLPSNWEQGIFQDSKTNVGCDYDTNKVFTTDRIRVKELVPVSGTITISNAYSNQSKKPIQHCITAFDINKKWLGASYVNTAWSDFPRIVDMKDAKYISVLVKYKDESAITPSDISQICLKIERGTSATPFTLAPEDVNGKIVNVETIANQTAKKFEWIVKGGDSSSNFTLTDRVADLVADRINFNGLVTFSGLNTDAKNEIGKVAQSKVDGLEVGGRNLARGTSNEYSTPYTNFNGSANTCFDIGRVYLDNLKVGDMITVHMYIKYDNLVAASGKTIQIWLQGSGNVTLWNGGSFPSTLRPTFSGSGVYELLYSAVLDKYHVQNEYWNCGIRTDYIQSGSVQVKSFKVEKGNKATDWTPAPEDYLPQVDLVSNWTTNTTWIDGGKIYTGSITADKIATDAIRSKNYVANSTGSFLNLKDGSFDSKYLKWDASGNITAKGGTIGKYKITDQWLITGSGSTCTGIGGNQAFWAGAESSDSAPFRVGYDGKFVSSNADISGKISATSGKVGKYEITDTYLKTGSGSTCSGFGSDYAFWAGNDEAKYAPFKVEYDGTLNIEHIVVHGNQEDVYMKIGKDFLTIQDVNTSAHIGLDGFDFDFANSRIKTGDQGIELYGSTPYIDFHYDNSYSDYTSRIIAQKNWDCLSFTGSIELGGDLYANGWIYNAPGGHYTWNNRNDAYISCGNYNNTNNIYYYAGYHAFYVNGDSGSGMMYIETSGVSSRKGFRNSSDERIKQNFSHFDDNFINTYMNLEPVQYQFKNDTNDKYHFGFKAQQTERILNAYGQESDKSYGICATHAIDPEKAEKLYGVKDMHEEYTLAYDELIAPTTYMVQHIYKELTKVKQEKADLEARLQAIEAKLGL